MSRIDITATVRIYERNGVEAQLGSDEKLTVRSHWNRADLVRLELDGKTVTVAVRDLQTAIGAAASGSRL